MRYARSHGSCFFKIQRKCTQMPNNAHQEWLRMS